MEFDRKAVYVITLIGIPSAFLLHGYVGFIFGSVKANPWWSSVLMPIVFLFSAIVSGIALVLLLYYVTTMVRRKAPDMACFDKLASFLLYALIIDLSLETAGLHPPALRVRGVDRDPARADRQTKLFISLTIVKSLRGLTFYKMQLFGAEGLLVGVGLLALPFVILYILVKLMPPWEESRAYRDRDPVTPTQVDVPLD